MIKEAFRRIWHDGKDHYREQTYVPLAERSDWDGEVEKLPSNTDEDNFIEKHGTG